MTNLTFSAVLAAALTLILPAAAGATSPTVTATPALNPAFSASVPDYTTTCPGGSVTVSTKSSSTTKLFVDGKRVASGQRSARVALSPGQRFVITVGTGTKAVNHSVRCVPSDFPGLTSTGTLPSAAPFMAISSIALLGPLSPYAIVTDARGVPIWWKHIPDEATVDIKAVPGGRIGFWHGPLSGEPGSGPFSIYNLDGSLHRNVDVTVGRGDLHETLPTSRGTYYRIANVDREHRDLTSIGGAADRSVVDAVIQEIGPDGVVVWSWDSQDHISPAESGRWFPFVNALSNGQPIDMIHLNSIEEDGKGGLILSFRHLDAIIRIRKSDGVIDWKLGGTTTAKSLSVLGDPSWGDAGHFAGQHDARLQADGTMTLFDNGSGYPGRPPRALRWKVDTTRRTATLVESIVDPTFKQPSAATGGARRFADGSWLVSWAHYPHIRAYTAAHRIRFDMTFRNGGRSYRAAPISKSSFTAAQLRAGMDRQYPR